MIPSQIIRRTNSDEKYLVVAKERYGHQCQWTWIAVSLIQWDGIPPDLADAAYEQIADKTANYGAETERKCGSNNKKTCACQGSNTEYNGASYTFGCSWTMYTNCCKFCKSSDARKFRLKAGEEEGNLENICHLLTDAITPHFAKLAPDCYNNMCLFEEVADDCRIGKGGSGRPFSGITTVLDFCAHSHKDTNNMIGGCTVVVTLNRPENRGSAEEADDEQFHVLPLYIPDATPEELQEKVNSGGLEALSSFNRTITVKNVAKKACKRGRMTAEKKRMLDGYVPENFGDPLTPKPAKKNSPLKRTPKKLDRKRLQSPEKTPQRRIQEAALEEGGVAVSTGFVNNILSQFEDSQQTLLQEQILSSNAAQSIQDVSQRHGSSSYSSWQDLGYSSTPYLNIGQRQVSNAVQRQNSSGILPSISPAYSPSYQSRPIPSARARPSPVAMRESPALYNEFTQPVSLSFGQYRSPPPGERPHIRTIMINNPCLVRQMPTVQPIYSSPRPAYIPRIPHPATYQQANPAQPRLPQGQPRREVFVQQAQQPRTPNLASQGRPMHPPQAQANFQNAGFPHQAEALAQPLASQAGAMPVSHGFVNNIVNQFSDSDSILALLEETHGQVEVLEGF